MKQVILYGTEACAYCQRAKALLTQASIPFREVRVDLDPIQREEMERLSQCRTVPQIFIGGKWVGGFENLQALWDKGELVDWL
jgi:glutaredoxin 3